MREIVFDTETTGLDPMQGHKVVEIGCVEIIDFVETGRTFHVYINPERSMPKEAEAVHGISAEFLKDKPKFPDIAKAFLEFIGGDTLVAHNASFDMNFLNMELKTIGLIELVPERVVDTLAIARRKFPGARASLDALCQRFGVDASDRDKHGALLDAQLLARVYAAMQGGGQQGAFDLGEKKKKQQQIEIKAEKTFRAIRSFPASAEERAAHMAFVESLPDALWKAGGR